MRKNLNRERIEGRIYQHSLAKKTVQNEKSQNYGKSFISGEIEVAVDDNCLNIIPVHFTYVTEETSKGAKSPTYSTLEKIIEENKTVVSVGAENAMKVRINTALALNDFYNNNDELVSAKRNEGGFVTIINELGVENERNTFEVDMVITKVSLVEADEEKNVDEHVVVRGAIFNFNNAVLPIDFIVESPAGMEYFLNLDVSGSEPVYTKVWGKIVCKTIVNTVTQESAFGEPSVRNYERKSRNWVITGMAKEPYAFDDENTITVEELQKAMQDRQVYLAEIKKRVEDYKASRNAAAAPKPATSSAAAPVKRGNFTF